MWVITDGQLYENWMGWWVPDKKDAHHYIMYSYAEEHAWNLTLKYERPFSVVPA